MARQATARGPPRREPRTVALGPAAVHGRPRDANNDVLVLRGAGAPSSFTSGGSSNVDVATNIDGDTVITLGSDNDSTGTITLKGVSDSVTINTSADAADAGAPTVDLSSGTVTAADAGEIFEYSVKFLNGVPVAIDGEVTISGFDSAVDKIVLKTEICFQTINKTIPLAPPRLEEG